jgi:hypothetical protein
MKRGQLQQGKGALELIEETFHAWRLAPASALFAYYLGSVPFVLGLLYFWSDMSRGAFAERRLAAGAFALALLFLWMKTWQAVFAHQMLARVCGEPAPRWTPVRLLRAALAQAILQPSGLFVLPVALAFLLPFGWAYAFYQNVTALGTGDSTDVRRLFRQAWQQARLWTAQNNVALAAFKLFGLFVVANLVFAFFLVPFLLKTLLGIETHVSRLMQDLETVLQLMLNSTFLTALLGLAYLCLDPLLKTFYVLRCFYGESLRTGQDLKTELRSFRPDARLAAMLAAFCLTLLPANAPAAAASPARDAAASPATVSPSELDLAIADVITQREYSWRLPREKAPPTAAEKGWLVVFVESVFEVIADAAKTVGRWLRDLFRWLNFKNRPVTLRDDAASAWLTRLHWAFLTLIVVLVCILAVMLYRMWRRRRRPAETIAAQAVQAAPDVSDENVGAEQLPEDGWVKLARELIGRGDLRLALRALYLASLAHLAARGLLTLARFKSNRDYDQELGRRSHALPELARTFTENVAVFDRVWYGLHEVSPDLLDQFTRNVERIKTTA